MGDPFTMVIAIVAIVFGAGLIRDRMRMQHSGEANSDEVLRLESEVAALSERVTVLEQIVTDPRFDLKQELKRL